MNDKTKAAFPLSSFSFFFSPISSKSTLLRFASHVMLWACTEVFFVHHNTCTGRLASHSSRGQLTTSTNWTEPGRRWVSLASSADGLKPGLTCGWAPARLPAPAPIFQHGTGELEDAHSVCVFTSESTGGYAVSVLIPHYCPPCGRLPTGQQNPDKLDYWIGCTRL